MICKNADSKAEAIATLESLLARATPDKKALIDRELRMMRAGVKGEQEAAYLIDFQLKESKNTAVVHDLRVQLGDGRVAQIDHLLIHRTLRFYILETKHFSHGVKITDEGEFLRWNDWKKTYEGIPSPIEQNERHAAVLRTLLSKLGLGEPKIESMILIAPQARIDRSKRFDSARVVKADQFLTAMQKNLDNTNIFGLLGGLAKASFSESIGDIAKKLIRLHRPITIDYAAKFGMASSSSVPVTPPLSATQFGHSTLAPAPAAAQVASAPSVAGMEAQFGQSASPLPNTTPAAQTPAVSPTGSCRKCQGMDVSVQYGKYGYYFRCASCDGNTPIKLDCGKEGHKERLRKDGLRFYRECADCQSSAMFFTNRQ
ncbi:nuclease-related domain-containing protein [Noviherbaspirillum soli]|uniref:nuclease-related domain-containing protein n=1 Tax=Noviherbaspirillum soli TaxID=1064518 RepID=UPI00188DACF2|nr:nuclease-related domain-containing protein [Noviherbaspirillum soli]